MSYEIQQTNLHLPGQIGPRYQGKVADTYSVLHPEAGNLLVAVRTDRISAFEHVFTETIPYKGQVLNEISAAALEDSSAVAPNWLIGTPDPNVSVGFQAEPFALEMIVRANLLGSAWRKYDQEGMRRLCGNHLPDGMAEFEPFPEPLVTPTTKVSDGGHDEDITPSRIVEAGLASKREYHHMADMARRLFSAGQFAANDNGLYLADTKYEFGRLQNGQIVVIDEVHTPDSSRYYELDSYEDYRLGKRSERPQELSKEFLRKWLLGQGYSGDPGQTAPALPAALVSEVSQRYVALYERVMDAPFQPEASPDTAARLGNLQDRTIDYLANLAVNP